MSNPAPNVAITVPCKLTDEMKREGVRSLRHNVNRPWEIAIEFAYEAMLAASPQPLDERGFQDRVQPWMMACFGPEISADRIERNHRFLEESLELVQSLGCTRGEAHQLVDYTFDRPIGEASQEVGGVMVTLAALCLAAHMEMAECGETELRRIWAKVDVIRAKQAAKPKHSPLPVLAVSRSRESAIRAEAMEAWAVANASGEINVSTVSSTERAAKVNWLYVGALHFIPNTMNDEAIEALWQRASKEHGVKLVAVQISSPAQPKLECTDSDGEQHD